MSYWLNESPITKKPYFVKSQDVLWKKLSQSHTTMQAPCGASNISDREYQVLWFFDKAQIDRENKVMKHDHFPFGFMKSQDSSTRVNTHNLRSCVFECPFLEMKTLDSEGNAVNLAQKPMAWIEYWVSYVFSIVRC